MTGWGDRIHQAILDLSAREGRRISYAAFGAMVAAAEVPPRSTPYSAQTVHAWVTERGEPGLSAWRAMAIVVGKPEAWLPFGVNENGESDYKGTQDLPRERLLKKVEPPARRPTGKRA
jgi:hypothetical protein